MSAVDLRLSLAIRPRRQGPAMAEMNTRKLKDGLDYLASKASPSIRCDVIETDEAGLTAKVRLTPAKAADVAALVAGTGLTVLGATESEVEVPQERVVPRRSRRA